jgi:hypothetical protein
MYWATDAPLVGYCSGAGGWIWKRGGIDVTPVVLADFPLAYNTAAGLTTGDLVGQFWLEVTDAAANVLRGRVSTIPATPYTVIVCTNSFLRPQDFPTVGIMITNGTASSSAAYLMGAIAQANGAPRAYLAQWSNATTPGSQPVGSVNPFLSPQNNCWAVSDNGTTRRWLFGADSSVASGGWLLMHSESSNNHLTPTHWGVYGSPLGATLGSGKIVTYSRQVLSSAL